ncbi:uncharacterized protein LOC132997930 [Limanda limanda]|uniref:uncharacterized protein LOC132997930 n=1 Tax=Limanda limanda TaxID=27771 RepID=UPI0029C9115F|nr:uncharacterized protein LOC132997930 [Limanda limanda]
MRLEHLERHQELELMEEDDSHSSTSVQRVSQFRQQDAERKKKKKKLVLKLMMWSLVVLLVLATAGCWAQLYENEEGGLLARFCPNTEAVSHIRSTFVGSDRIWNIECKPFIALNTDCSWSGFLSLYEKELNFNCKANHVITGVYSLYNQEHMDRQWNFLCCSADDLITFECRESPKVNYYDEDFNWLVPGDNYLTGARTYSNSHEGSAVSSQILTANSPIANLLTHGDVAVQTTRSAKVCTDCRWTKLSDLVQVPFILSDSFSSSDKAIIQNAINGIHQSTCVRFVPQNGQNDHVNIVKQAGCWSYVGQTGGSQQVSLGDGCLSDGIIQHELLHVLGFWHEQSRTDRDLYVQIHKDNVQDDRLLNFDKVDTYNLNVPYDYSSIMHYGLTDFSKNGLNTITPHAPGASIGQRLGMSENDMLKINKLYGCSNSVTLLLQLRLRSAGHHLQVVLRKNSRKLQRTPGEDPENSRELQERIQRTPENSRELQRTPENSRELQRTPENSRRGSRELQRTPENSRELQERIQSVQVLQQRNIEDDRAAPTGKQHS